MASNKECVIFVLDVRRNADAEFKRKSIRCVADVLKDKIVSAKKDYVSFVLLGTQRTFNDLNSNVSHDGYLNVVEYSQVQVATWQLLINFFKFVNEEADVEGDWLDALVVATKMLRTSEETFKFQRSRIVLFYDFNEKPTDYDMFDVIVKKVNELEVDLIVVSHNIAYIDNAVTGEPEAIFPDVHKNECRLENEKHALQLVSECNATLCNFNEALSTVLKVENKQPWTWNSQLSIGTKIVINVSGVIAVKNESHIKLKKCWAKPDEVVTREFKYYLNGEEIKPEDNEVVDGYMLGATPIAFEDELWTEDVPAYSPGLHFVAFTKREYIPDEHFTGNSMYLILHQKGKAASARMLDALVKALHNTDMVMICFKVFSAKFKNPKLVVLFPNEIKDDKPATLSMIELTYKAQHLYWDFPSLCTTKTECSKEQLDAIDDLIDAMDLTFQTKDPQAPRNGFKKDLLPFETLPHIYEQNVMDILERTVICNASEDDEQFQEMLKDKNFVEVFWKVPELIEEKAKKAAQKVKKLFPLEKSNLPLEKAKARAAAIENIKLKRSNSQKVEDAEPSICPIERVGRLSPALDFEVLLKHNVLPLQNRTLRDSKFHEYAQQMRTVIWNLLFQMSEVNPNKIVHALKVYRQNCYNFNALDEYNTWIRDLRAAVMNKELYDFWRDCIVKNELGLCIVGEPSLEEQVKVQEFYSTDA